MKKTLWILIPLLIISTALRFWHNLDVSLWHDEAFSALLIKYSWSEMMYRIGLDVHPPAYYIALRFWSYAFGDSLLALRGFSVFFGVATIVAGFALAKDIFKSEKIALVTAVLIAFNPFQVQYVTEARMYTFGAFFAVFGAWCLVNALTKERESYKNKKVNHHTLWYYAGFIISTSIMIYTHYYLLFTASAICSFALIHHLWFYRTHLKKYLVLVVSYLLIAISYLPWLKTFLFQYKQVSGDYWIPPMNLWSIPGVLYKLLTGLGVDIHKLSTQITLTLTTILVTSLVIWLLYKAKEFGKFALIFAFLAPFAGSILFFGLAWLKCHPVAGNFSAIAHCKVNSVFLDRYFLYASSFLLIMIAWWIVRLKQSLVLPITLAVAILSLCSTAYFWKDSDINNKQGMGAIAKVLHANVKPDDKVIAASSFQFFNLKYYARQKTTHFSEPTLFSGGNTSVHSMPHYAGTAILTDNDLTPSFENTALAGTRVWIVWTTAFGGSKPEVPKSWKQLNEYGYADLHPYAGTWIVATEYVTY